MNNRIDLSLLQNKSKLFREIIGNNIDTKKLENRKLKIGFFVWARSVPKELFNNYIALNNLITDEKFNVLVDDNCSRIFMKIDFETQKNLVEQYLTFFKDCNVFLSSEICHVSTCDFFEFLKKFPSGSYYNFLPEKKKQNIDSLSLGELMHTYLEIRTIQQISKRCDVLFVGKRSSNIAYLYHEYIDKNCTFIIIDDF